MSKTEEARKNVHISQFIENALFVVTEITVLIHMLRFAVIIDVLQLKMVYLILEVT